MPPPFFFGGEARQVGLAGERAREGELPRVCVGRDKWAGEGGGWESSFLLERKILGGVWGSGLHRGRKRGKDVTEETCSPLSSSV